MRAPGEARRTARVRSASGWKRAFEAGSVSADLDPVCLVHGMPMSEHVCLYCCLCFKRMTPEECHMDERGDKWDVCDECAFQEAVLADSNWCNRR